MFFGQIWSYNLDFFKLTEMEEIAIAVAYYDFNVYFFKVLSFI